MSLRDGYIACMLHDVKKTLLSRDSSKKDEYGSFSKPRDHINLDELEVNYVLSNDLLDNSVKLENDQQTQLIKAHHGRFDLINKSIKDFDIVSAISLVVADAMHKSLYFSGKRVDKTINVGLQFPFYYPFYGRPIVWLPDDQIGNTWFQQYPNGANKANARSQIFKEFQCKVHNKWKNAKDKSKFLNSKFLIQLLEDLFSNFPDTTYLPVTSLNFHSRFSAALFFFIYQKLKNCEIPAEQKSKKEYIHFYLNTIVSPPEKLTNRLKDTTTVRKISHLLQHALHEYMKNKYLNELEDLNFCHPNFNPFFFYNKDAIVLVNDERDQEEIERICRIVSGQTESILTINSINSEIKVNFKLELKDVHTSKRLSEVQLKNFCENKENFISIKERELKVGEVTKKSIWLSPEYDRTTSEKHCYVCNKPLAEDINAKFGSDQLCEKCKMMRKDFKFCQKCNIFFKQNDSQCPYNPSHKCKTIQSPELLQKSPPIRVAYVLIKTNCEYQSIKADADALMASFRLDRCSFEKVNNKDTLKWNLAQTSTTSYGIFEYLQAVLDMTKFQSEINIVIKKVLESYNQYSRKDEKLDVSNASLLQYFLYRSPTLTLVVIPEKVLLIFFREVERLLNKLNISHFIRIMTCNNNHPVWMVLRSLGINKTESLINNEAVERAKEINEFAEKARECARNNSISNIGITNEVFNKSGELLALRSRNKAIGNMKCNELKLIIHRSGIEREFLNDQAYFLLREWQDILDLFGLKVKNAEIQSMIQSMDKASIPDALRQKFRNKNINLQKRAKIYSEIKGDKWSIKDRNKTYLIRKQDSELRVRDPSKTLISMTQLGYLSEFADGLLSELKEIGMNPEQKKIVKDNLILDLRARTVGKSKEIIDRGLARIIEVKIRDYQNCPEDCPIKPLFILPTRFSFGHFDEKTVNRVYIHTRVGINRESCSSAQGALVSVEVHKGDKFTFEVMYPKLGLECYIKRGVELAGSRFGIGRFRSIGWGQFVVCSCDCVKPNLLPKASRYEIEFKTPYVLINDDSEGGQINKEKLHNQLCDAIPGIEVPQIEKVETQVTSFSYVRRWSDEKGCKENRVVLDKGTKLKIFFNGEVNPEHLYIWQWGIGEWHDYGFGSFVARVLAEQG